ncbi:hypothetical protein [Cellvibrio sp. NN19]|uniref:hypothetical protein n=1 Tax=Cellvibrio chitinivorans TaxID=3102792 RepID=UPI002B40C151|nr:hypothetical protein [Cellvibrio sp. NN19]
MKIFQIKHSSQLTWGDIPYVEAPVFAHHHIMNMLIDPNQLWMRIQNIQEFIRKEVGRYKPLQNHDLVNDRINYLISSTQYFNVSLSGKPFRAAFEWQSDENHLHKGFWEDKSNHYWLAPTKVKNHLMSISNNWHRLQTLEFTENLLDTPYEIAQEKIEDIFSVVHDKPKPITVVRKENSISPRTDEKKLSKSATSANDKLNKLLNLSSDLKIGSKGDGVLALQKELGFTGKDLDGHFGGKTNSVLSKKISILKEYDENVNLLKAPEVKAFLSVLGFKESGNRYNVITGGEKFSDLSKHPNIKVWFKRSDGSEYPSTASGAYQFTYDTWNEYGVAKGLPDFSSRSQDLAAISLLRDLNVISELQVGNLDKAIFNAAKRWDAFPLNESGSSISGGSRSLESIKNLYNTEFNKINVEK